MTIDYNLSFTVALRAIGRRAKQLRLLRNLRQEELASRAGVGVATIHRFEKTGTASIVNVLRIATALGVEAPFATLFETPAYKTLDEALARPKLATRKRAARQK